MFFIIVLEKIPSLVLNFAFESKKSPYKQKMILQNLCYNILLGNSFSILHLKKNRSNFFPIQAFLFNLETQ